MRDEGKVFLDCNIVIYIYCNNEIYKQGIAQSLFKNKIVVISTQVLQETANTLHKKFKADYDIISAILSECVNNASHLHVNTKKTVINACSIAKRFQLSFYDSVIISSALEAGCQTIYSEDMQHNMLIDNTLTIVNPFI